MDTTVALPRFRSFPDVPPLPEGWCLNAEIVLLYTTAFQMPVGSSILELGSWAGRSTCAIAYGLRDSGHDVRFDLIDFGIAGAGEWARRFGHQNIYEHHNSANLLKVIDAHGGAAGVLKQNLVDRDLSGFVSMMLFGDVSDYETTRRYDFIYCDAAHSVWEMKKTMPHVVRLLNEDCILICDDMHTVEQIELVLEMTEADNHYSIRNIDDCSRMVVFTRGNRFREYLL